MAAESDAQSNPFIRQLASSDRRVRDQALASLRTYLQRAAPFSELDFRKLWKGLFYCMWMSDKPRNQQQLARDLADLTTVVVKSNLLGFIDAFWKTMAAEWNNIDRLRMDKYLYLVRCYVKAGFECCSKAGWDNVFLNSYLQVLADTPLNAKDNKIPNGLRYHTIDVYVDELDAADKGKAAPLMTLLDPLKSLKKDSPTKPVRERVDEALQDERLQDWNQDQSTLSTANKVRSVQGTVAASQEDAGDDGFGGFGD